MKVATLAGARRPMLEEPPAPTQYRWSIKTWLERRWQDYDQRQRQDELQHMTFTVVAATHEEAKRKVEQALPLMPDLREEWVYRHEKLERKWELQGTVEEVER